jgi:hypothetical protein
MLVTSHAGSTRHPRPGRKQVTATNESHHQFLGWETATVTVEPPKEYDTVT